MPRYKAFLLSTTCLFAFFLTTAHAQFPTRPLSQRDAVLVIDSPQMAAHVQALPDRTVHCTPAKRLGIWIGGAKSVTAESLTVRGCDVGVLVTGTGHTVRRIIIDSREMGMICLACANNTVAYNTIGGAVYGLWISGHGNTVDSNTITGVSRDAIFLAHASYNMLVRNVIRGAGRMGINVVPGVAQDGLNVIIAIAGAPLMSWENTIRENDVQGSGRFDLRQWPVNCRLYQDQGWLENLWENNVAGTVSNWCLRGPRE